MAAKACGEIAGGPRGAGRDGALEAVTEFAAMSDALARRIEEASPSPRARSHPPA